MDFDTDKKITLDQIIGIYNVYYTIDITQYNMISIIDNMVLSIEDLSSLYIIIFRYLNTPMMFTESFSSRLNNRMERYKVICTRGNNGSFYMNIDNTMIVFDREVMEELYETISFIVINFSS